jgi:hypothetical protein
MNGPDGQPVKFVLSSCRQKKIANFMNRVIHNKKWFPAGFLLVLFCSYMVSITCFAHLHIVGGRLVVHSHPYKGVPDNPGHSHTAAQFISIALFSHFAAFGAAFAGSAPVLAGRIIAWKFSRTFLYGRRQILPYSLRAPPLSATV